MRRRGARLLVVGDALLDRDVSGRATRLAPDAPVPVLEPTEEALRPGGAALAAVLAARDGLAVTLLTALDDGEAARLLRMMLAREGVELVELPEAVAPGEKIRLRCNDRTVLRIDRSPRPAELAAAIALDLDGHDAVLVADYGRGVAGAAWVRSAISALDDRVPVVWDPHPRGADPVAGVTVVTPNEAEARGFGRGTAERPVEAVAADLRARWGARAVCVTRGADGVVLVEPHAVGARSFGVVPSVGDACGAGDRFASALAGALAIGLPLTAGLEEATAAAAAFVEDAQIERVAYAATPGAAPLGPGRSAGDPGRPGRSGPPPSSLAEVCTLARRSQEVGRRVVATGGCFDLLHAGHLTLLSAAADLGDVLVVLVNDDASIRRLKGASRPLRPLAERLALLRALGIVDAAVAFAGDDPGEALAHLRPDVWAKGSDHAGCPLPEAPALAACGARTVFVPLLEGRSTSALVEEIACRSS